MDRVVLAGGRRSAFGAFRGSLSGIEMTDLAGRVGAGTLQAAGLSPEKVDHIVFTTTVPSGRDSLFSARVVGQKAGLPEAAGSLAVVRACASGLQALISASQQVASGIRRSPLQGAGKVIPACPMS